MLAKSWLFVSGLVIDRVEKKQAILLKKVETHFHEGISDNYKQQEVACKLFQNQLNV
jgi:hypothetical protein